MAETVQNLEIEIIVRGRVVGDDGKKQDVLINRKYNFADGNSANQLQSWFYDETRNLNATSEDIDLNGSASYKDFQGDALALTKMKVLLVENLDTDTGDKFLVGGASANQMLNWVGDATDKVDVGPGGLLLLISPVDGYTVTASTGDLLKVEAVDNSNYRVFIAGDNA